MNKRPIGITILAILHFFGGISTLIVYFLLNGIFQQVLENIGISSIVMIVSVLFLGLLAISSGIGMWLGKQWGWWLAASYYIYAIARYGNHIITVLDASEQLANSSRGVTYWITKDIIKIITSGLIFLYFFKNNVKEYFRIVILSNKRAVFILLEVLLGIFLLTFLVNNKLSPSKSLVGDQEKEVRYSEEIVVINDAIIDQGNIYQIMEPVLLNVTENNYDQDLEHYSAEQKYVHAILNYESELYAGGHELFYSDYIGMVWKDALDGFQKIGLTGYYNIIKESADRLGGNPSRNKEERQAQIQKLDAKFDDLDQRFLQLENDQPLEEILLKFIKDNRDKFYYNGIVKKPTVQ